MTGHSECQFCGIVAGTASARIVARYRGVIVFFPEHPATRGHILVVPTEHVENIWELSEGSARNLASAALRMAIATRAALQPEGLNVIQSNGVAASQTVDHMHVHVVPRWSGDAIGSIWPQTESQLADKDLDATAALLVSAMRSVHLRGYDLDEAADREDRRKHLDLVSAIITRMAASSAAAKGWSVTLAGAAFGVAVVRSSWALIALGILVLAAFAILDARYLENERRARCLYDSISDDNSVVPLSMSEMREQAESERWWRPPDLRSWSIAYFYGPLVIGGILLLVYALLR